MASTMTRSSSILEREEWLRGHRGSVAERFTVFLDPVCSCTFAEPPDSFRIRAGTHPSFSSLTYIKGGGVG